MSIGMRPSSYRTCRYCSDSFFISDQLAVSSDFSTRSLAIGSKLMEDNPIDLRCRFLRARSRSPVLPYRATGIR